MKTTSDVPGLIALATPIELIADTNVVSYMFRRKALGEAYFELIGERRAGMTLLSLAELSAGVVSGNWAHEKIAKLDALVGRFIAVPATKEIANLCGTLLGRCEQIGRAMTWPDAWAAATSIWFDVPLVTHDRDLEGIPGLRVLTVHSEWRVGEDVFGSFSSNALWLGETRTIPRAN